MRILVLVLPSVILQVCNCCAAPIAPRIVVGISGRFSSTPNEIRTTNNPGPFPLPSLLGGSFAGSFEYRLEPAAVTRGYRHFPFSDISIAVFDNAGNHIHTILLPTSGEPANPLKVGNGEAYFALGPSFHTQSGHVPRMPTDIRFFLLSSVFSPTSDLPPSAATLNSASLYPVKPYDPFVELDDIINPFSGWDLPITSMSWFAREVPEPSTCALLFVTAMLFSMFPPLMKQFL
jgi:hypothetical protein